MADYALAVDIGAFRLSRPRQGVVAFAISRVPASQRVFAFRGAGFRSVEPSAIRSDDSSIPEQAPARTLVATAPVQVRWSNQASDW